VIGDVRARCDTDVTDAEITAMIAEASAWLDLKVGAGTMTGLTAPMRRLLAATLTAIMCMLKDPNSQRLGEYAEDRDAALKKLNDMLDEMLKDAGGGIGFRYGYEQLPRSYIAVG
jgi:hypothetical protein